MLRGTSLRALGAVVATLVVACVIAAGWAAPADAARVGAKRAPSSPVQLVVPSCAHPDGDEDDGNKKCGHEKDQKKNQSDSSSQPATSSAATSPEQPEGSRTPKASRTPPSTPGRGHRTTSTPPATPTTSQGGSASQPPSSSSTSGPAGGAFANLLPSAGGPATPSLQVAPINTVTLPRGDAAPVGTPAGPGAPPTAPSVSGAGGVPLPHFVRLGERPLLGVDSPLLIGAEIGVFALAVGGMVATAGHRGRRTH